MLVAGFPSLATATNCWVVALGDGERCLIIDPGLGVTDAVDDMVREHRLHPAAVLLTHGHFDHTFSVLPICQASDIPAYIHPDDREQLTDPWGWAGLAPGSPIMGVTGATIAEPDDLRLLADGERLEIGGVELEVRHTPGHSRGSVVFGSAGSSMVDGRAVLFSGDVLFAGSIGRTDLRGGSMTEMLQSLRDVVVPMDDDIVVLPGHGPSTTIGRERGTNPFLLELVEPRMKPTPLSGFPELLPAQRFVELAVIDTLREVFELNGFAPVEMRAAEPLDALTSKGEIDKEVYVLRRLHAAEGDGESSPDWGTLGLHFDLTVPFARWVLEHAASLDFPFRRYQIQKVWRGERPQEGRYREFTQADIDVIARDSLPFHHDVEVARVMAQALARFDFVPPLRLQVNNRKLIEGFYRGVGANDPGAVMRAIDKLDKLPPAAVADLLIGSAGLSTEQAKLCLELASIRTTDTSFVDAVTELGVSHELLSTGLRELRSVIEGVLPIAGDQLQVEADLSIARGLDYYTGTVFETRMAGFEHLGSICSGGRYDSLASDGATTYPGVGISLGVTRMLVPLLARGGVTSSRSVPSVVFVALVSDESRVESEAVADALRSRGIACEVASSAQKFGRQIRAADRRGIPFVWFPATADTGHQVKDIVSGDQVGADPATWNPPDEERKPRTLRLQTKDEPQ